MYKREYRGLFNNYPSKKIIFTYLVPYKSSEARQEYDSLMSIVEEPNLCFFVTWIDEICDIIDSILSEKSIPCSTEYILQSLGTFVNDSFCGYDFISREQGSTRSKSQKFANRMNFLESISNQRIRDLYKSLFIQQPDTRKRS